MLLLVSVKKIAIFVEVRFQVGVELWVDGVEVEGTLFVPQAM
jgi:hypothetical protein